MSLQHTANHLAAQGRYGDSMLMHVSPNEVAGLQALAQQHGRSMTTNPETGMPEAFEFKDLIPTAAGFALDYFLPGAGQAAAGLFGLTGAGAGAIGTAGIVGGLTGLASGSFKDGLLAGVGAYGGASLAGGLGAAGSNANTLAANAAFDSSNPAMDAERVAAIQAAAKPDIGAGFKAAAANPIDFLKNNKFGVAAAALPALMSMGSQSGAPVANRNPGYIRRYVKNPVTGALEQESATPVDEFGGQSAVSFGGVGRPVKYAAKGGVMGNHLVYNPITKKYDTVDASGAPVGPVSFGGVARSTNMRDPNDNRTDSQKAYEYLMGVPGAKNPMLFYHQQDGNAAAGALVPADLNTRTGGHYVINASGTGYDWVPDASTGIASLVSEGGPGGGQKTDAAPLDGSYDVSKNVNPYTGSFQDLANGPLGYLVGKVSNALSTPKTADEIAATTVVDKTGVSPQSVLDYGKTAWGKTGDVTQDIGVVDPVGRSVDPATGLSPNEAAPSVTGIASLTAAPAAPAAARNAGEAALESIKQDVAAQAALAEKTPEAFAEEGLAAVSTQAQSQTAADNAREASTSAANSAPAGVGGETGGLGGFGSNSNEGVGMGPSGDMASGGLTAFAHGGLGSLGGYSDGGRLLRGPGDGVSDSIPATIGRGRQPARLADGEFVIPARIVSELGNGSTEAGAKQLYAMLARIQAGRAKTTGKNNVAKNSRAARYLPA